MNDALFRYFRTWSQKLYRFKIRFDGTENNYLLFVAEFRLCANGIISNSDQTFEKPNTIAVRERRLGRIQSKEVIKSIFLKTMHSNQLHAVISTYKNIV